jgi:hypothetical protein
LSGDHAQSKSQSAMTIQSISLRLRGQQPGNFTHHSCCMLRCFLSERFLAVSAWLRGMTDAGAPGA